MHDIKQLTPELWLCLLCKKSSVWGKQPTDIYQIMDVLISAHFFVNVSLASSDLVSVV